MVLARTEAMHRDADGLDTKSPEAILQLLNDAQIEAAKVPLDAISEIVDAAECFARTLSNGGRIAYAAAGSSGLMALADALELPGTFGIPRDRIIIMLAGGIEALTNLAGAPEDDADQALLDFKANGLKKGDCLIAISASGSTPYAFAALTEAKNLGMETIAIANNAGTPLMQTADIPILLQTPPEVVAGSTRMGAGTAQKIALNLMSTLAAIHLGHVHDGHMVNLHADNIKLRVRAARIVSSIAGCTQAEAEKRLAESDGSVKAAILLAAGAKSIDAARELLEGTGQKLRPALSELEGNKASHQNRT